MSNVNNQLRQAIDLRSVMFGKFLLKMHISCLCFLLNVVLCLGVSFFFFLLAIKGFYHLNTITDAKKIYMLCEKIDKDITKLRQLFKASRNENLCLLAHIEQRQSSIELVGSI